MWRCSDWNQNPVSEWCCKTSSCITWTTVISFMTKAVKCMREDVTKNRARHRWRLEQNGRTWEHSWTQLTDEIGEAELNITHTSRGIVKSSTHTLRRVNLTQGPTTNRHDRQRYDTQRNDPGNTTDFQKRCWWQDRDETRTRNVNNQIILPTDSSWPHWCWCFNSRSSRLKSVPPLLFFNTTH